MLKIVKSLLSSSSLSCILYTKFYYFPKPFSLKQVTRVIKQRVIIINRGSMPRKRTGKKVMQFFPSSVWNVTAWRHSRQRPHWLIALVGGGGADEEVYILRSPGIAASPISLLYMRGVCGRSLTAGKILFTGRQACSLYLVLWLCVMNGPCNDLEPKFFLFCDFSSLMKKIITLSISTNSLSPRLTYDAFQDIPSGEEEPQLRGTHQSGSRRSWTAASWPSSRPPAALLQSQSWWSPPHSCTSPPHPPGKKKDVNVTRWE